MLISYIIPTRDRPDRLHATLEAINRLRPQDAEVVIIDNDSEDRPLLAPTLGNGVPVRVRYLSANLGAASRNIAAAEASGEWLVMLDDDSHPTDGGFVSGLRELPASVAAVMADIVLAGKGRPVREAGGLPEVFVGCGVAIRREVFTTLGGYDASFGYYAEEYDLAARLLGAGFRIVFDPEFRVLHHKEPRGRDMSRIVERLIRNNGWVMQRYAPEAERRARMNETIRRYHEIAVREDALGGFSEGLRELRRTVRAQRRTPLAPDLWDRFTGLSHARAALHEAHRDRPFTSVAIIDEGKNCWVVTRALAELGVRMCPDRDDAEVLVIGTMSPGPMLDSLEKRSTGLHGQRVIAPWLGAMMAAAAR